MGGVPSQLTISSGEVIRRWPELGAGSVTAYVRSRPQTTRAALHMPLFPSDSSAESLGYPGAPVEWMHLVLQKRRAGHTVEFRRS